MLTMILMKTIIMIIKIIVMLIKALILLVIMITMIMLLRLIASQRRMSLYNSHYIHCSLFVPILIMLVA